MSKNKQILFKLFQACFPWCKILIQWQSAQEIYVPKVSTPSDTKLSGFRPTALINVEGKLLFSLISRRSENSFDI